MQMIEPAFPVADPLEAARFGSRTGRIAQMLKRTNAFQFVEEAREGFVVSLEELFGRERCWRVSQVRQDAWRRMKDAGFSSVEIARIWERDHSTVLYGIGRSRAALQ